MLGETARSYTSGTGPGLDLPGGHSTPLNGLVIAYNGPYLVRRGLYIERGGLAPRGLLTGEQRDMHLLSHGHQRCASSVTRS
jgi:hypothetical protein